MSLATIQKFIKKLTVNVIVRERSTETIYKSPLMHALKKSALIATSDAKRPPRDDGWEIFP